MLSYIYQLPQHIVALIMIKIFKATKSGAYYVSDKIGNISLGEYIILKQGYITVETIRHEKGHQKQSRMLGPLYLIVVGIPSLIRAIVFHVFKKDYDWYHKGYPEKWADDLMK